MCKEIKKRLRNTRKESRKTPSKILISFTDFFVQDLKKYFDSCQGEVDANIVKV